MNREQLLICDYLLNNAFCKSNSKPINEIAIIIGVSAKVTNNNDVKAWMKDPVINDEYPIGTTKKCIYNSH